jgi:hypothetical protein
MQYQVVLAANEWQRIDLRGKALVIFDQGAAGAVGVRFFQGSHQLEEVEEAGTGFRATMNDGQFTGIALRVDVPATVKFVVTDQNLDFDWFDGSTVAIAAMPAVTIAAMPAVTIAAMPNVTIAAMPNVTIAAMPNVTIAAMPNVTIAALPAVTIAALPAGESIGDPLFVSPVDPPAQSITDNVAVAVGDVAVQLAAADANRRALRFANIGTDPVTLGGSGITWAKRVIVLNPGDVWVEDRAGNLAWYGITNTGLSASVTVQGIGV